MPQRNKQINPPSESRRIRELALCICSIEKLPSQLKAPEAPNPLIEEARGLLQLSERAWRKRGELLAKMRTERAAILASIEELEDRSKGLSTESAMGDSPRQRSRQPIQLDGAIRRTQNGTKAPGKPAKKLL
jgi:hypothetical protein